MIPDLITADDLQSQRATLGQQVLDNQNKYLGQKTQTIRDTTDEMGKTYMRSLWTVIEQHAHLKGDYYIAEYMKRDSIIPDAVHCKHVARRTMPLPEWGSACYRVSNELGECFYEFGLPAETEAELMMQNPLGWDQKSIEDIMRFLKYLAFFDKHKPAQYINYHSLPLAAKIEMDKKVPVDIRKEFEAKLEAYWAKLMKDKDFL